MVSPAPRMAIAASAAAIEKSNDRDRSPPEPVEPVDPLAGDGRTGAGAGVWEGRRSCGGAFASAGGAPWDAPLPDAARRSPASGGRSTAAS